MSLSMLNESEGDKALMESIKNEVAPPAEVAPAPEPAPAEPAPEPVKAAEPPKVEPPAEKPQRTVPLEAVKEERAKRQELERRLRELEASMKPKAEEPDETADPIGAISTLKQRLAQLEQERQQAAEQGALAQRVAARVQSYAAEHPEYAEQYQFLQQSRVNELRLLGNDDATIARQIQAEEMTLGRMAIERDMDPGEVIANLAKARGWQAKAAPAAAAPASPLAPNTEDAAKAIERLERGQRAATSPSRSGGSAAPANGLSIEEIANLNGAAFDSAMAKFLSEAKSNGTYR